MGDQMKKVHIGIIIILVVAVAVAVVLAYSSEPRKSISTETASAYGLNQFGTHYESFHIEHFIAKIGSSLALFSISYSVLKNLPEVLEMLDYVLKTMRIEFLR